MKLVVLFVCRRILICSLEFFGLDIKMQNVDFLIFFLDLLD